MSEEQLDRIAGVVLLVGAALSFAIMLAGFVLQGSAPLPGSFLAQPPDAVLAGVRRLQPLAIVNLGILVLIATPVARVIIAIAGFALQRRWRFVGVSSFVFLVLMVSILIASRPG